MKMPKFLRKILFDRRSYYVFFGIEILILLVFWVYLFL